MRKRLFQRTGTALVAICFESSLIDGGDLQCAAALSALYRRPPVATGVQNGLPYRSQTRTPQPPPPQPPSMIAISLCSPEILKHIWEMITRALDYVLILSLIQL